MSLASIGEPFRTHWQCHVEFVIVSLELGVMPFRSQCHVIKSLNSSEVNVMLSKPTAVPSRIHSHVVRAQCQNICRSFRVIIGHCHVIRCQRPVTRTHCHAITSQCNAIITTRCDAIKLWYHHVIRNDCHLTRNQPQVIVVNSLRPYHVIRS